MDAAVVIEAHSNINQTKFDNLNMNAGKSKCLKAAENQNSHKKTHLSELITYLLPMHFRYSLLCISGVPTRLAPCRGNATTSISKKN
jgi:hypothetical protein